MNTMNATVILATLGTNVTIEIPFEHQGFMKAELQEVWHQTQHDYSDSYFSKNKLPIRSTAVGDIFIVQNRYFIVDNNGFVEVNQLTAIAWQKCESRETCGGWDWVTTKSEYAEGYQWAAGHPTKHPWSYIRRWE